MYNTVVLFLVVGFLLVYPLGNVSLVDSVLGHLGYGIVSGGLIITPNHPQNVISLFWGREGGKKTLPKSVAAGMLPNYGL